MTSKWFTSLTCGVALIGVTLTSAFPASADSAPDKNGPGVARVSIIEGSAVMTRYGPVRTDHVLFVGAGSFYRHKPSDLIPELQGRFPIRVELESLTREDFRRILLETENSLLQQAHALLETEGRTG